MTAFFYLSINRLHLQSGGAVMQILVDRKQLRDDMQVRVHFWRDLAAGQRWYPPYHKMLFLLRPRKRRMLSTEQPRRSKFYCASVWVKRRVCQHVVRLKQLVTTCTGRTRSTAPTSHPNLCLPADLLIVHKILSFHLKAKPSSRQIWPLQFQRVTTVESVGPTDTPHASSREDAHCTIATVSLRGN